MESRGALVSIVVPIYGVEQYLPRCVDSLLSQTHESLDIILVNDGSPDRSGVISDAYAASDPRVRVIHQNNTGPGPSGARNAGLEIAHGDYVMFVDPDDWVHEEIVAHLLTSLEEYDADLAVCGFERVAGNAPRSRTASDSSCRVLETRGALELYAGAQASRMSAPWAKLFRAAVLDGMQFPPGRLYEDEFFTYRVVARAQKVVLSEAKLYFYFVRMDSTTQRKQSARQLMDRATALQERGRFFQQAGLDHASAISFKKAFLLWRLVRSDVLRSGDVNAINEVKRGTALTIQAVQQAELPRGFKALAAVYSVAPGAVDTAHRAFRRAKSAASRRPAGTESKEVVERPTEEDASSLHKGTGRDLEVLVVAYGSVDKLRKALAPVLELPVTVVDNSSMQEIERLCEELGCHYLDPGVNGGFAAGVNAGLAHRRAPAGDLLLLNPDAVISVQAIRELQTALLADERLASVAPLQVDECGKPIRVTWPFPSPLGVWLDALAQSRLRPTSQYVSGALLLLRAEALEEIGKFDESFFLYAEEADWQYRAARRGWHHRVVDSVSAMHEGGGTSSSESKRLAHFHGSSERFLRKHYGFWGWQCARLGQIVGDGTRAMTRRGEERARLMGRAMLYLRGPMRSERSYRTEPSRRQEQAGA